MNDARAEAPRRATFAGEPARSRGSWRRLRDVRDRIPRAAWIVMIVVAGLYVSYLLAANVVLRTRLLRGWLDGDPSRLYVDYASAWSPYPGRVLVRDLSLRFQDDNVQFLLALDRASMSVDLLALTRRTFHVRRLAGTGASFRFRHKVAKVEGQEARLAAYPEIPGFRDPPLREPRAKEAPREEAYDLWTVHLEDVATSVRELWIMEYRYRGAGSVGGGMRLRPARELSVAPSSLVIRDGVVSVGEQDVLVASDMRVDAHVDTYDVRVPRGAEVLRQVTGHAEMSGELIGLAPLRATYLPDVPLRIEGGRGPVTVFARIDHGVVHPDTRVAWRSADMKLAARGAAAHGDVSLVGHVEPGRGGAAAALVDPEARAALVVDLATKYASLSNGRDALLVVEDARAVVATANTDLTGPFPLSSARLDAGAVRAPDLARLGALVLPRRVGIRKGAASGAVRASYRGRALDARADLAFDGLHVATDEIEVAADGKAWAVLTSKDLRSGVSFAGSGLTLDGAAVRIGQSRADGLGIAVEAVDGLLHTRKTSQVDTTLGVHVVPGDRALRLGASLASLPKAVGEAPAGPDARASVRLHAGNGAVDVRLLEARDGDLVVRGRAKKPANTPAEGAFLFEVGVLRAGLEIAGGETHVVPFASQGWLEDKTR